MKIRFGLSVFGLVGLFLFSIAWTKDSKNNISGLWELVRVEYQDTEDKTWKESEWMRGGNALLHYDDNGIMSVHFTPSDYESTEMPNPFYIDSLTLDHLKLLSSDYWYVAKFEVFENEKLIKHHRMMHSDPNEWGKEVNRYYDIKGDTLFLSPEEFNLRLIWVKS